MGYYDSRNNVEEYISMADGYDGAFLIKQLKRYLPPGRSVLEIGMGPGKDLDILLTDYNAVGSDSSAVFLDRYREKHPGSDLLLLDGVTLETERQYDALYSNKVLHHVSYDEMRRSFIRQSQVLNTGGLAMHSFWYGEEIEEFDGLFFYQVTESKLKSIIGREFKILEMNRFTEMEKDDSIFILLKKE